MSATKQAYPTLLDESPLPIRLSPDFHDLDIEQQRELREEWAENKARYYAGEASTGSAQFRRLWNKYCAWHKVGGE